MKKRLLYSGIVLLAGILALAGCSSPLSDAIESQDGSSTGRVQILVNGESGARTLAPDLSTVTYEVFYRPSGAPSTQDEVKVTGLEFDVGTGDWDIRVRASVGGAIIAEGTGSVTVAGGETSTVPIQLEPNTQGEYGTFHYALDYSELVTGNTDVAKGYLSLTPYSSNTANDSTTADLDTDAGADKEIHLALEDGNLEDTNKNGIVNGDIKLPAGIYTLDVRVTTDRNGYSIEPGDDHTNAPKGETAYNNENVDIHKTEIVYIYSGQTTSMDVANYRFTDADLAKLYFEGTLTLNKSTLYASTNTYKPVALQVYEGSNLLQVYTTNGAASTATEVKMLNDSAADTTPDWNWEVYVPSYELGNKTGSWKGKSLEFVFTLESSVATGSKKLYASRTFDINDEHGRYNVDMTRTIRTAELYVNDVAYVANSSSVFFRVESYKYNKVPGGNNWWYLDNTTLPPAYPTHTSSTDLTNLEPHNLDVISESEILVTVVRKAGNTYPVPNMQGSYDNGSVRGITKNAEYRTSEASSELFYQYSVSSDLSTYSMEELEISATVLQEGALVATNNGDLGYVTSTADASWYSGTYTIAKQTDSGYVPPYSRSYADTLAAEDDGGSSPFGWELPTIQELQDVYRVLKSKGSAVGLTTTGSDTGYWSSDKGYVPISPAPPAFTGPVHTQVYLYKDFADTTTWNVLPTLSSSIILTSNYWDQIRGYLVNLSTATGQYSYTTSDSARVRLVQTINY
jgi:hypothetical protein